MGRTRYEQETLIRMNEEEDEAEVYSASPVFARFMERLGFSPYKINNQSHPGEESRHWRIPIDWVRIQKPVKMNLSPEERERRAERARISFKRQVNLPESETDPEKDDL